MSWRLIYKDKKVYGLFDSSGNTRTKYSLFEALTLEDCFNEVDTQELTMLWPSGTTKDILFSGGTRTIIDNPYKSPLPDLPTVPDIPL